MTDFRPLRVSGNPCAEVPRAVPDGRSTPERRQALIDSIADAVVVTTYRPTPGAQMLPAHPMGIYPAYRETFIRQISCPEDGNPMVVGQADMACPNVDCRFGHGYFAALIAEAPHRVLTDGEWTD